MNLLEAILERLKQQPERVVLQEAREGRAVAATCAQLLADVRRARSYLRHAGLKKGDRCALLGHNSIRWVAVDLAIMAEGLIVVPLYARQAAGELAGMLRDCSPALVCCADAGLRDAVAAHWQGRMALYEEIFAPPRDASEADTAELDVAKLEKGEAPAALGDGDPVTIIYTSGTSGEPKGVVLTVGNLNHMLPCTVGRLDELMGTSVVPALGIGGASARSGSAAEDVVFHYLPFNFAGSWILLLSSLLRLSRLTMSTDLTKLMDEMKLDPPDYFLNVPVLLERVRSGVEEQIRKKGGVAAALFANGRAAWMRRRVGRAGTLDALWLAAADAVVFKAIRKKLGPRLRALICGSAPLAVETQLFFLMLGIPVLQVYGLTETTAICTMDDPRRPVEPGRVGPAIRGIEMRLGEQDEILVRGPNVFPGYWNRAEATASALREGWFHTGDQGEVNERGNWRVIGRVKNLIVLASGHNVPPEPLEEAAQRAIPGAVQVLLVGHGRPHLAAIVTGAVEREQAQAGFERMNHELPHYKRVRNFYVHPEPFSIENGLLTANGKLKRDAIAARFQREIAALYG